ncbi:MAG: flagellar biosynthetic protein FliR [Planctomycetota bacterium]|nr:flagellar biosynthetic protein FliR [Planctomycetota bacterium]|tara:strand:+ start:3271 stop:4050 length:780 start_codon:yes stop_codon:yes gene_type:complete
MNALVAHLPAAMLVVFRVGGLMIFAPVFGSNVVPLRVRILLAFVIGLAIYPLLHGLGAVTTEGLRLDLFALAPLVALEILVGLVIGLVASLPLVAMQMGGLLMGQQMGLGFATFYNPAVGEDADVLGQLLFFLALVGFLVVSGHEAIMTAVMNSFGHVPLGGFVIDAGLVSFVTGMMLAAFEVAIRVAAPVLAIIFLQSIAMGFVSRTVPQLNILSLGFPLRILVGFAVLIAGLAVIEEVGMQAIDDTLHAIMNWVQVT